MNKSIEKAAASDEASVSRLAYQLWENAGRPAGRDLEFWLAAEAKVRTSRTPSTAAGAIEMGLKETSAKAVRPARVGAKKSWPKPYPNLPKF